ncbi:hypothetical protein J3R82DRAFT_10015 [Butyriboletus roseoflavus]|nr:hypothetical protein J3R82DRAFT_10015 [Butyriboletus roseoflavus]
MDPEAELVGGAHKIFNDDVMVPIRIWRCSCTPFPKVGVLVMTVKHKKGKSFVGGIFRYFTITRTRRLFFARVAITGFSASSRPLDLAGNAEHHRHMELSLESYQAIVKHVGSRVDLCTLCRDAWEAFRMCRLFATTPRLAAIVEALTLFVGDEDDSDTPQFEVRLPNNFWPTISEALHHTTRLRFLNLQLDNAGDAAQAWILDGIAFRLRTFHCDLQWDAHLVSFLNTQPDIDDLYIVDYSVPEDTTQTSPFVSSPLNPSALPELSTLECTFAEAACALVPTRPISRLKTCFSKTRLPEKRVELSLLFSKLMETTHPLCSLDIADSSYSEPFSMDLLASVVGLQSQVHDLRYFGTLVLPIDGHVRLRFYGLLRVLPSLECVEVDVSEWDPPPPMPAGLRALASELRLYCPSLRRVIFVNDFERTVIAASDDAYAPDYDTSAETIWREF